MIRTGIWIVLILAAVLAILAALPPLRPPLPEAPVTETPAKPTDQMPASIPVPDAPLPPVELIAIPSPAKIRMGQAHPIRFHLRNAGAAPVDVLPSLDGSELGQRYPRCLLSIEDERGEPVELPSMRGCGLYNRLVQADFRTLQPGETLRLDIHALRWMPPAPGAYTITLTYDSSSLRTSQWHQEPFWMDADVFRRLSQVPHVRLRASVRVDVEP